MANGGIASPERTGGTETTLRKTETEPDDNHRTMITSISCVGWLAVGLWSMDGECGSLVSSVSYEKIICRINENRYHFLLRINLVSYGFVWMAT